MAPKVTPVDCSVITSGVKARHTGKAPAIRALKRRYPDLSESAIARKVGCDPSNVHRVLKRYLGNHTEDDLREFQAHKADVLDSLVMRQLTSITDDKLLKASSLQLMTGAAIGIDKSQLLRGLATSMNVNVLLDLVQAAKDLRDK